MTYYEDFMACSPLQLGEGVKNIRKVFAGGSEILILVGEGGSRNFNFEVKIKIA